MPAENGKPENIATAVTEVSERVTLLIREEVELAKAEVMQKVTKLARGAAIGAAAGVFGIFAFIYLLSTIAWGLNSVLGSVWEGFAIVLLILVVLTVAGGLIAYRMLRVGPPVPTLALAEAEKIRATVTGGPEAREIVTARPESTTTVTRGPEDKS